MVRDDRLVVPRGDTVLQVGDEVLVLVTADAEQAVHALFVGELECPDPAAMRRRRSAHGARTHWRT